MGRITSGMFGHTIGCAIGLGYVESGGEVIPPGFVEEGRFAIEIAGVRYGAQASLRPFYDPANLRVKDLHAAPLRQVA